MQHYRNCYIDNNHLYGVKTVILSNKTKIEGMSLHFPSCDVTFLLSNSYLRVLGKSCFNF